ncbi:hypothetical protein Y032_0068g276 [Ancylostoma ceylanicum]|uniref:C2H2-type domain-containing protein n=1 Tax=Ancylostoma ceylanicum TaxID=53326 RepID=A0A016TZ73_9BILA|nr:hypothetical protein Y032_0068g276 [Ancylostoma ceylanicum]
MLFPNIRFIRPKERCGVEDCRFADKVHAHCTMKRCHFSSNDELIIANHVAVFHAGLPIPTQLEFFHIDSDCSTSTRKSDSSPSSPTGPECPYSGKKSHYHCLACNKYFINISEHPPHQCQALPRYDANKMVCSRPFCKLKKKQLHFHCSVCDQGFSDRSKFRLHATKHKSSISTIGNITLNPAYIQSTKPWSSGKNNGEILPTSKLAIILTDATDKWPATRTSALVDDEDDCLPLDLSVKKPPEYPQKVLGTPESHPEGLAATELPFTLRRITFSL